MLRLALAPSRPGGRLIAAAVALCTTFVVLPSPASAASDLSYPAASGPLTVTAVDAPVAIAVTQTIATGCTLCNTFISLQSPQLFTTPDTARCTNVIGDGSLFQCKPLPSVVAITGSAGSDTLTASGTGAVACASPAVSFSGLDGADELRSGCAADVLRGGSGRDTIDGAAGSDDLDGGADADALYGGPDSDTISGGDGNDVLVPGTGADGVSGGAGVDTVSYEERSATVVLSIGGAADGELGEGDTIADDVENVVGGAGNDTITGSAAANGIDGGPGNDAIDPGAGSDIVDAGSGADVISARDGVQDRIVCGDGADQATVDAFDTVDGCESVDSSRALMPDVDNDGIAAPADCNDANASIRPGLPDRPGDGIDQDCSGADAGDVDNDGIAAPTDCNDANAAIRPGLPDRPGNGIDEDCADGDAPYPRVLSGWAHAFRFGPANRFIRYTKLDIIDVPDKATVELVCRGLGCFKGVRRSRHPRGATRVRLAGQLRSSRLRPRSVLEVRITRPETVGKIIRFTTQQGKRAPVVTILCRAPGTKAPHSCTKK